MPRSRSASLLLPVLVAALAACGDGAGAAAGWAGTIDTLAGGRVLVRNPERGAWRSGEEWKLVEELRIGSAEEEGPALFGNVMDVEVDGLGRVWVVDSQAGEIRVFGPDGRHVRTIGRKGSGPGEFQNLVGIERGPGERIWAYDFDLSRFSVFDTAGRLVTSHLRRQQVMMMPWRGGFDARGRFYDASGIPGPQRFTLVLLRYDSAMAPVDTMTIPRVETEEVKVERGQSRAFAQLPYGPMQVWERSRDGGLWTGVTGRYELHHLSFPGDTTRTIVREHRPVPVTAAEKDSAIAGLEWFTKMGGRIDRGRIPDVKPAFEGLLEDNQGFLWVAPSVAEGARRPYDVFDPEGRYLSRVEFPGPERGMYLVAVRGDRAYGVVSDDDGVQYVVRYRIDGRGPRS